MSETTEQTHGVMIVLHTVTDLEAAKAVFTALLGVAPQADAPNYVGYDVGGQHIGLLPASDAQPLGAPISYWRVDDIEAKVAEVTAAGATLREPVTEVGPGRRVATVIDPSGNVLGLVQEG